MGTGKVIRALAFYFKGSGISANYCFREDIVDEELQAEKRSAEAMYQTKVRVVPVEIRQVPRTKEQL